MLPPRSHPPSARALPGRKERDTMPYDKELITHKLIRWEEYLNHYKLPAWKELPDIGLYMDQVIALLAQYLDFIPVEDQKDKPVTPTTINNYVRLKVMPAPEKRRYYRVHIAFLIMIFTLKQGISIGSLQIQFSQRR